MLSYLKNKLSPNELLSPQDQQQQQPDQAEEALHQEWRETAFNLIRQIRDPEKPETLEQLDVVQEELVEVLQPDDLDQDFLTLKVTFVPTVPHCSLATLIGLCIRTKLVRDLPPGMFKIDLAIKEGSHSTGDEITKQINDKERVAAALENPNLLETVEECINHVLD